MNRQGVRLWWVVLWATAVSLLLVGCDSRPKIEYRVSGASDKAEILYREDDGDMVRETVNLPWKSRFRIADPFQFEISVYGDGQHPVTCAVWINSKEVGSAEGLTFAECLGEYAQGTSQFRGRFDVPKN